MLDHPNTKIIYTSNPFKIFYKSREIIFANSNWRSSIHNCNRDILNIVPNIIDFCPKTDVVESNVFVDVLTQRHLFPYSVEDAVSTVDFGSNVLINLPMGICLADEDCLGNYHINSTTDVGVGDDRFWVKYFGRDCLDKIGLAMSMVGGSRNVEDTTGFNFVVYKCAQNVFEDCKI